MLVELFNRTMQPTSNKTCQYRWKEENQSTTNALNANMCIKSVMERCILIASGNTVFQRVQGLSHVPTCLMHGAEDA